MKRYDIVISGGGMIGAIAANAAIKQGFKVLLIEANQIQTLAETSNRELRVSAISLQNIEFLKELNIYKHILASRIHPYHFMQVWDNPSKAEIKFETDYSRQECLGFLIENNNLIQAAFSQLNLSENCDLIQQNQVENLENDGSQVRLQLTDKTEIKSKLVIAAEGRQSKIRELVKINIKESSYHQKGLVAYIKIENAPKQTALQAFNPGGPIGVLPFGKRLFSIVWSLEEQQVEHWLNCSEEDFSEGLKQVIGKDFGNIELTSQRAAFPLTQLYAEKYFQNRVVLSGDTAHGIHPLAGQGVNLGIGDINELFSNLNKENLRDDELLHLVLRKYQRRRISKVTETSEMMSVINNLFRDDKHIKKPLRALALNYLNKTSLKNWFATQAGS